MDIAVCYILPLLVGVLLDKILGDPAWLPHPIVGFGKVISKGEKLLNKGSRRKMKGGLFVVLLIAGTFILTFFAMKFLTSVNNYLSVAFGSIIVYYCLAGKTLVDEVRQVFLAVERSVEEGRQQVARIVGRDTSQLSPQQIKTAALETLSENLSDGVIAPLFWYLLLGVPGMLAYKMINTLDSMIGYKNERYKRFGYIAAKIDDIANYIPARLTAFLMIIVSGKFSVFKFVTRYGRQHASPNSGYPEAALVGILNCRFGGANMYSAQKVDKPYIGNNPKILTFEDMQIAVGVNRRAEILMVLLMILIYLVLFVWLK